MSNQIVVSIDSKLKTDFSKNLKKEGISGKAFLVQCIKAFNSGKLSFGITTNSIDDTDINYYNNKGFVEVNESPENILAWMKRNASKKIK